ncbi:MAG: protoheme IX farnesyltransferase [Alphaproteobacteria bacterium]|nr:protoheme IX farnesyltransferase [Alphaproteobacteria bacterium]
MTVKSYMELLKLRIGFMIALTAVVGYLAVAEHVSPMKIAVLTVTMVLGAASASVFNHFYDRDIDRLMARTAGRPLASGKLSHPFRILWLSAGLLVAGMALALSTFNWVVAAHLFLGSFFYGIVYTVWLKRRSWVNIIIGGAAGSFAVLAGAAAVDPSIWMLPWLLALTLFLWTPSHFWSLAITLKEDYRRAGVPMLPCVIGDAKTAKYIMFNTLLLVGSSLLPFAFGQLGRLYAAGAVAVGLWFLWLNWRLVKDPSRTMARINFMGSMQYLLTIFIAVFVDRHAGF